MGELVRPIRYLYLHHSASPSNTTTVEEVHRWHTAPPPEGRGWSDTGYHAIITRQNGWWQAVPTRPQERPGAHVGVPGFSNNSDSLGVCILGQYHSEAPHPESPDPVAIDLAVAVMAAWCRHYHLDPLVAVRGHREAPGAQTVCPGDLIDLEQFRQRVARATTDPMDPVWGIGLTPKIIEVFDGSV